MRAVEVFAVPGPPSSSTDFFTLCSASMRKRARVESMVGTSKLEKSSLSPPGYRHTGGAHRSHSSVCWLRAYSYTVSPGSHTGKEEGATRALR